MFIDHQQLIKPVSELEPSGSNLEYAPEFARLERTALGTPDRFMGDAVQPGTPADPLAAIEQSTALLGRTKDLRVALHLQRALLTRHGILGFLDGLVLLRRLIEEFWDGVHPGADPDDVGDFTMRANTVSAVAAPELLLALRQTAMIESRTLGPISLQDLWAATGETTGASPARVDPSQLGAVFREQPAARLVALVDSLQSAVRDLGAISLIFRTRAEHELDLGPLSKLLERAIEVIGKQLHAVSDEAPVTALDLGIHAAKTPTDSDRHLDLRAPRVGAIQSRHDVLRALEQICTYYANHEPSSPLPILLQRCQRLATLDFMDIVKELAPDALSRIELIAGTAGK